MTLADQLKARLRQWAEYNRWEAQQPPIERSPAEIVADVGAIWDWLPPDVRLQDPDPDKQGIKAMRSALARLTIHS